MFYVNMFFIFSCLGHVVETVYAKITKSNFSSGILYGPITPLYGVGVIIITLLSNYIFKILNLSKLLETVIFFIAITIVLTFLEWLCGILIEKLFHVVFWDYSSSKFSIGHYICLSMSVVWGASATAYVYLINPWIKEVLEAIPVYLTVIMIILFLIDVILTIKDKIK